MGKYTRALLRVIGAFYALLALAIFTNVVADIFFHAGIVYRSPGLFSSQPLLDAYVCSLIAYFFFTRKNWGPIVALIYNTAIVGYVLIAAAGAIYDGVNKFEDLIPVVLVFVLPFAVITVLCLRGDVQRAMTNESSKISMPVKILLVGLFILCFGYIEIIDVAPSSAKARRMAASTQIQMLLTVLDTYRLDVGTYPTTEQGLQALRVQPEGAGGWNGPYLIKDLPNDPWHHPYNYTLRGNNPGKPEIISYGADGAPGGAGDSADISSDTLQ
jgi:general secretion pathway protein G